jgi:hypothetical protein
MRNPRLLITALLTLLDSATALAAEPTTAAAAAAPAELATPAGSAPDAVVPFATASAGVLDLFPAYGASRWLAQVRGTVGAQLWQRWSAELDLAFAQSLDRHHDASLFGVGLAGRFVLFPDGIGPTALVGVNLTGAGLEVPGKKDPTVKVARSDLFLGPRAQLGLRWCASDSTLLLELGVEGSYWRWLHYSTDGLTAGVYLTVGSVGASGPRQDATE